MVSSAAPAAATYAAAAPTVAGAWIRANPVTGRASAGYLTITGAARPDRLVGVSAPGLRIEMHSMEMATGIMRMAKIDGLDVPAKARAEFASGGNHLMIYGLAAGTKSVPLTLTFKSGAKVTAAATVRGVTDEHSGH
jgi:copper(I)-binding protein